MSLKHILLVFVLSMSSYEAQPLVDPGISDSVPIDRDAWGCITSPNYPDNYGDSMDVTSHRSVKEGSRILITFTDFEIDDPMSQWGISCDSSASRDWVRIVDGDGTVLLDKSCGYEIPPPITSRTNRIVVDFHSDNWHWGKNRKGFRAEITPVPGPDKAVKAGVVESPNYPDNYDDNMDEEYPIIVDEGDVVKLTFTDFDIEKDDWGTCWYDSVVVWDRDGTVLLDMACGTVPPEPITSNTNRITVWFHSDGDTNKRGFRAEWEAVEGTRSGCTCGVANRRKRIVGGVETEENEYPWQVALTMDDPMTRLNCGGSLIDDRTVLTAAHCTASVSADRLGVWVGLHDWRVQGELQEHIGVEEKLEHDEYEFPDNDFALLKLNKRVEWRNEAQPLCLPETKSDLYEGDMATVTGWGRLWKNETSTGPATDELREVDVKIISNNQCYEQYSKLGYRITDNMLCATEENGNGGKDSCSGDSGGPLFLERKGVEVKGNKQYEQVGVVSWGTKCALKEAPGVYARVTAQLDWIKKNMYGETCH